MILKLFLNSDFALWIAHVSLIVTCAILIRKEYAPEPSNAPETKKPRNHQFSSQEPSICRQIISGSFQYKQSRNIIIPQESRAIPNHRLEVAFGIDNSFTRKNKEEVDSFVATARDLINLSPKDWVDVSHLARLTTDRWIVPHRGGKRKSNSSINISNMVQVVTLRIVLSIMFKTLDHDKVSDISILHLAQSINRTWIGSKTTDDDVYRFEDNTQLQQALFDVLGVQNVSSTDNPLNLILPFFETMWRIVLRAVLEIGFATGAEQPAWKKTFAYFSGAPTKEQFERTSFPIRPFSNPSSDTNGPSSDIVLYTPSAKHLVWECLRLYIPTRRVHRAYQSISDPGCREVISADIEGCHLRSDIWGDDAQEFNPHRWLKLTPRQKEAFMPFGCVPFECPAKPTFGPRMIGLLVGALLVALENDHRKGIWELDCEDETVFEHLISGERLDLDRNAYGDLYLVRSR